MDFTHQGLELTTPKSGGIQLIANLDVRVISLTPYLSLLHLPLLSLVYIVYMSVYMAKHVQCVFYMYTCMCIMS